MGMKKAVLISICVLFVSCLKNADLNVHNIVYPGITEGKFEPPEWIQGTWLTDEEILRFKITFTKNNILNENDIVRSYTDFPIQQIGIDSLHRPYYKIFNAFSPAPNTAFYLWTYINDHKISETFMANKTVYEPTFYYKSQSENLYKP